MLRAFKENEKEIERECQHWQQKCEKLLNVNTQSKDGEKNLLIKIETLQQILNAN